MLRYLSDAYRALRQTVPPDARTEEFDDIAEWLGELIRQVDSSLIDEWEQLTAPGAGTDEGSRWAGAPKPITANRRAFRTLVRNALFRRVLLAAREDVSTLAAFDPDSASTDGRRRWTTTTPTTTRSAPTPRPADRRISWWTRRSSTRGRCGRSSPTRPATTTGRSPPRSTWPPPMPRVTW